MGPGVTFRKGYGWAPVFQIVVAGTRERGLTQSRSVVDLPPCQTCSTLYWLSPLSTSAAEAWTGGGTMRLSG